MCAAAYRGRGCHAVYVDTLSLFKFLAVFLSYSVLLYCRNLTWPLFRKDVFVRNGYFFSNEINLCRQEISFFYLKPKLAETNFIEIESYVHSIF